MSIMKTSIINSNWWCKRTILETCFILISAFVIVLPANQMAEGFEVIGWRETNPSLATKKKIQVDEIVIPADSNPKDLCLSEECVHTASAVLSKIKTEVKPCDDFYQFACGNYIDETQIAEDKSVVSAFTVLQDKVQEQIKAILAEEIPYSDPKHFKLPKMLYKACMNTTLIETRDITPIKQISDALGGWPVIVGSSWDSKNIWTFPETVKLFRRLGFSIDSVVDFSIDTDFKNNTKRIISLDQSLLGLSREFLVKGFNEPFVSAYYDYMVDIAILFGAKNESAQKELRESLQFEMNLAKISLPNEKRRNNSELYNLRTIKELQDSYPYIHWLDYINALLPEGLKVDENEVINLNVPTFFANLGELLQHTDKRAIANYMMWRIYDYSVEFLPERFLKRQLQYATVFTGKKEDEPRWKKCVNAALSSRLSYSLAAMYVSKHFKKDSKVTALKMVNGLRAAFSQILDEIDWMDQKTRQEAKRKLHAICAHIGYADELLDNDKLAEFYSKLVIDPDRYFESYLDMNVFSTDLTFSRLRLPVNRTDWITRPSPPVVNALYMPTENSIQFPAGILQGHFFNRQRPKYMNYGAIGSVIGHEITHGFDDRGRQFDLNGNLVDWWQPETEKTFLEKTRCMIEQYGNFTDKQTNLNLNGINTQGENIADNGGTKISYLAYKQWLTENGEELSLPGLNYTSKQMFWISFAQTSCRKFTTELLKNLITTNEHSPEEFRVLGTLRNSKDFSRDFQCEEGTPMNPEQKCEVW